MKKLLLTVVISLAFCASVFGERMKIFYRTGFYEEEAVQTSELSYSYKLNRNWIDVTYESYNPNVDVPYTYIVHCVRDSSNYFGYWRMPAHTIVGNFSDHYATNSYEEAYHKVSRCSDGYYLYSPRIYRIEKSMDLYLGCVVGGVTNTWHITPDMLIKNGGKTIYLDTEKPRTVIYVR